ncbi:DUF6368 family protein [Streptomyces sp. NPDC046237]|uniref:DUF6368 family protein n=1 Tax=Streptomyces sp. NPDC046237 TaxID=3154914 RepID=UPI0033FEE874
MIKRPRLPVPPWVTCSAACTHGELHQGRFRRCSADVTYARTTLPARQDSAHIVTALLTAAVMDVLAGVSHVEPREDQVPIVAGLPGVIATTTDPWPAVYGSAEFLRAWAQQPGLRLLT